MKVVIPGGTGQVGQLLARAFHASGDDVVVLSRSGTARAGRGVAWDGTTLGPWASEIDGADVVVNLAGKNVNCRYTAANFAKLVRSRVDSTRVVGEAIAQATRPPPVWLQASTATIYAHRFDASNDEATGIIGGDEPGAPQKWRGSIEIATGWERALDEANTPHTRKVALRTSLVMNPDPGSVFSILLRLCRFGLGGPIAGGRMYMSWIHPDDFIAATRFLIEGELSGSVNLTAPEPLPQRDFMKALRTAAGVSIGLPATGWMVAVGAFVLRTETELLLKSRRVAPGRLLDAGFSFAYPTWPDAAADLVTRWHAEG